MNKKKLLVFLLTVARFFGGFKLARWVTRKDLRILCYHGAALRDEHTFRGMFIRPQLFADRMAFLVNHCYPVLGLSDALQRLDQNNLPNGATVITIDDGWVGTALEMAPILKHHNFPSTLYISTYYIEKQTQVFNVAVDYVLWRSSSLQFNMRDVDIQLNGTYNIVNPQHRQTAASILSEFANTLDSAEKRQSLLRKICFLVDVDPGELEASRVISFMTKSEARDLQAYGVDLQLHTHRHRFPIEDFPKAEKEIEDNRNSLKDIASSPLQHFCYPSGEYEAYQLPWLQRLDIVSATTTKSGFNTSKTNRLKLGRFLDSEYITDIEFEAEMSGFLELIRRCGYAI